MSKRLILKNVRISYPHILTPEKFQDQDPKYSAVLLIKKDDPQVAGLFKAVAEAADEKFPGKTKNGKLPSSLHNPIKDGDEKADDAPEYTGCWYISTSSKTAPYVCDRRKRTLTKDDSEVIYPGCYVNASVNFAGFDVSMKKGVGAYLNGVQFFADGERLAGHDASEDFDELDEDDLMNTNFDDYDI